MGDISQIKLPDNTTYNINAKTVNGHTVNKDVPSSAVFTDQYVTQIFSMTEDDNYRILLSGTVSDNTKTESVRKSSAIKINPKYDAITIGYDRASGSAYGVCSLTQGSNIVASGQYSHGEGWWTIANHRSQHVFGEYNIADASSATVSNRGNYIEIVGNGTENSRSNARTLDWSGNEVISGVYKDKYGVQCSRELTKAQYNALSTAEQNNGTDYYITDEDPSEYTDVWTKLGTAVLNTSAKNCSGAINELKQSLSQLELDTITLTNQTTTGQGLIITNLNYDGRWISAEVAGGRYASFRPSGANKLVIRLVDDNGDAVSSTTVTVKLYHLGAIS